jgi:hypothetical protein
MKPSIKLEGDQLALALAQVADLAQCVADGQMARAAQSRRELDDLCAGWNQGRSYPPEVRQMLRDSGLNTIFTPLPAFAVETDVEPAASSTITIAELLALPPESMVRLSCDDDLLEAHHLWSMVRSAARDGFVPLDGLEIDAYCSRWEGPRRVIA